MIRISVSNDLLTLCPKLKSDREWESFAKEFDMPKCRKNRSTAARACKPPVRPKMICDMARHCFTILRWDAALGLPDLDIEGEPVALETAKANRIDSAIILAEMVELLLSDSEVGRLQRKTVGDETKRLMRESSGSNRRNVYDLCLAFLNFIKREEKLPTKKELNIEANHLQNCTRGYIGNQKFGDVIYHPKSGSKSRADRFHVYESSEEYAFDEITVKTWSEYSLIPNNEWGVERWPGTQFSDVSTPAGFKGLREANEDKGKVRN